MVSDSEPALISPEVFPNPTTGLLEIRINDSTKAVTELLDFS